MCEKLTYAETLVSQGYRVVSRKYKTVSRIDRFDWIEYLAKDHAPWDIKGEGMDWARSSGTGDYYRRCCSKDKFVVSSDVLKMIPSSGEILDHYIEK